jgi:hypothetical protein
MVAAFQVLLDLTGTDNTPGSEVVVANLRFNAEDTNDQDLASPVIIPGAGTEYSYIKHIYLDCTTAPDTQVDAVKLYTDDALGWGTGVTVQVGDGVQTKNSGSSAGYDVADAQEVITTHTHVSAKTDLFTYDSAAPRTMTISEAGSIINAIGESSDYAVVNMEVASTAVAGTKTAETVTWQYDEV